MIKILSVLFTILIAGCNGTTGKVENKQKVEEDILTSVDTDDLTSLEERLKKDGYRVFSYKAGDTTYLMQQYYMVFLTKGPERSGDSTEVAKLQEEHLDHLNRMYEEGYTSLTGPMGDDGDLRGIVVFNTPSLKEADSLARLDPMVKAGHLKVEVHPWWVAKGGKLK